MNTDQIIIMGGQFEDGRTFGDVIVFDTRSHIIERVWRTLPHLRFTTSDNHCTRISEKQVAALVKLTNADIGIATFDLDQ